MGGCEPINLNKISFDDARKILKEWRDSGARRSEETVEIWENVLRKNKSSLGDEVWIIYEQLCFAALDCHNLPLSDECLKSLNSRFPNSSRILKLRAMFFEVQERYDSAMQIYDSLIESDPANNGYRKRKIALLIAQAKRTEAIKELNEYLQTFLNDTEAWIQLSEMFLAENDLPKAVHCLEECVLITPLNSLFLRRLADLRYCQGGQDNIELAKSYYEQVVKLNSTDLRGLYGIVLCSNYLSNHTKGAPEKKKDAIAFGTEAVDKILEIYEKVAKTGKNSEIASIISAVQQTRTELTVGKP